MTENKKTNNDQVESVEYAAVANMTVDQDLKHSVLIVSVLINLIIFTTWIALQVTTQYDTQIASLLFAR